MTLSQKQTERGQKARKTLLGTGLLAVATGSLALALGKQNDLAEAVHPHLKEPSLKSPSKELVDLKTPYSNLVVVGEDNSIDISPHRTLLANDGTVYFANIGEANPAKMWHWSTTQHSLAPPDHIFTWRVSTQENPPLPRTANSLQYVVSHNENFALWRFSKIAEKEGFYGVESRRGSLTQIPSPDNYIPTSVNSAGITAGVRQLTTQAEDTWVPAIRDLNGTYTYFDRELTAALTSANHFIQHKRSASWVHVSYIHKDGTVLGSALTIRNHAPHRVPFIRHPRTGSVTLLPTPSEYNLGNAPTCMNSKGQIVGSTIEGDLRKNDAQRSYGVIWQAGLSKGNFDWSNAKVTLLNHPVWNIERVIGITDDKRIATIADFCPSGAAIGHDIRSILPERTALVAFELERAKPY